MTADTRIKDSFRIRRVAGGALLFISLPLNLILARFAWPSVAGPSDALFLLLALLPVGLGFWAAFPRRRPALRMTISDQAVTLHSPPKTINLAALQSIRLHRPALARTDQIIFKTDEDFIPFNVIHLTHEAPDIISLIGIRLENKGRYLCETRSDVLGARTGLWEVQIGPAFDSTP
ncbi:hypothetical protein AN191_17110 [Loktanella sp. 5RATIMAR09]|uniref:hypothetical protein n=1 Tax=Loktanella sp. 5RATIMAR09 TaxID=1225655 RepID=UPI0006EB7147|nr:hypothetical protein [Loktanella sp. 5RATIMAR09]KQI70600.1 hypothetical protein AN191_17110 [Loktanella sp. 5RATIMAR09]